VYKLHIFEQISKFNRLETIRETSKSKEIVLFINRQLLCILFL